LLVVDPANTSETQIKILWEEISTPEDGGSEIISYSVQWDAGNDGTYFYELVGYSVPYLSFEYTILNDEWGLTPGLSYIFRYRALNKYGWGEFGEEVTFLAAAIPLKALPVTT
jgi:hypothetical protein